MKRHLFGLALALLTFSTLSPPSLADGGNVVLGGHCAVAYVAAQKPVLGDPKLTSEHGGRKYYFSSEGAKKMFDADPNKFAAHQCAGWNDHRSCRPCDRRS